MFFFIQTLSEVDKNVILKVNFINSAKSITKDLKWYIEKAKHIKL